MENNKCHLRPGMNFFFFDTEDDYQPERCRIDTVHRKENGVIDSVGITFFDEEGNEGDFDVYEAGVCNHLFRSEADVWNHDHIEDDATCDATPLPDGCECCAGDNALFWDNTRGSAFVNREGEIMVTAGANTFCFQAKFCPNCGRQFGN